MGLISAELDSVLPTPAIRGALATAAELALRWRWAIMAALAAVSAWLSAAEPVDTAYFATPGGWLLGGHLGRVYRDASNQGGPLQLIATRLSVTVSHHVGPFRSVYEVDPWAVALANVGLVLLAMAACRAAAITEPGARARRELLAGSAVLLWLTPEGVWNGHPFEVAIPVLWIVGLVRLRRGRWLAAAALFGLSVAVAPWAALGFACLLAAPRFGLALRAGAAATVIGTAAYLPFVFSGHFRMFHYRWKVTSGSLVHLVVPGIEHVGWGLRLGQAVVVVLACGYVARRYRSSPLVVVLAPLTAVTLRLATDPVQLAYYWMPVAVVAIALVAMVPAGAVWARLRLTILGLVYLSWAGLSIGLMSVLGLLCLLLVGVLLVRTSRPRLPILPPAVAVRHAQGVG